MADHLHDWKTYHMPSIHLRCTKCGKERAYGCAICGTNHMHSFWCAGYGSASFEQVVGEIAALVVLVALALGTYFSGLGWAATVASAAALVVFPPTFVHSVRRVRGWWNARDYRAELRRRRMKGLLRWE